MDRCLVPGHADMCDALASRTCRSSSLVAGRVVSRRQVLDAGGSDFDIARMLRRRELTDVHRGVYVSHSGQLTLRQQHWAAVLAYWPAALAHVSALPGHPTSRLEHALIDVVSGELRDKDVAAEFAVLARVCATRRTTPQRMVQVLATRQRVCGRTTLEAMLADLRDGACSVLERGYLHRVERAHGLPKGERQSRSTATGRRVSRCAARPRSRCDA